MKRLICTLMISTALTVPAMATEGDADHFVISANRTATPLREVGASISVVTAEELEAQGVLYVEEALRRLPGVTASASGGPGGQSAVRLRGEEGYRTLVLIDGMRVSDPSGPQTLVNFTNLTVAGIERIEVLRGPQALLYGADAIGGVINIITRRGGDAPEAALWAEAGSHDTYTGRGFVSGSTGDIDGALGGSYTRTRGFSAKVGDPTLADDDGYRNLTLHGTVGTALGEDTRLEVVGRYVDTVAQFDGFSFDPDRTLLGEEIAARASLTTGLWDGVTQSFAYNFFQSRRDDLDGGQPTLNWMSAPVTRFDADRHELDYLAVVAPINGHGFTVGAEYETEEVTTDSISDTNSAFAGFAEWQAEWTPQFFTTLGARVDAPENLDEHVSLRATVAYLPVVFEGLDTKLRASAGTGFRAPSSYERATNAAASLPDLHEETAIGFDVGIEQEVIADRVNLAVTYFDQRIEDEIRYDNVSYTGYFQSNGTSHSRGVEVEAEVQVHEGLTLTSQYTYTDATVNSPDPEDGLPRVRRPVHMTSTDLDYVALEGRLHLNLNVRSAAEIQDGFREFRVDLDDHVVWGAAGSFEVLPGIEVTARAVNIGDEDYQEVDGFASAGRAGYIGVRVSY